MKHNKKRNTAFLYEILLREGTKASLEKDFERLKIVKQLIVENFNPDTALGYELNLYRELSELPEEDSIINKILSEVKARHSLISRRVLFNEQTKLIDRINKNLGFSIYNNFIPNYKNLATISQLFSDSLSVKEKILLEENFIKENKNKNIIKENLKPIDAIVYKTFVKKFNDKYSSLLFEQKELLTKYVSSFADDGLELKVFVNEEIERLKEKIYSSLQNEEIKKDNIIEQKTKSLLEVLKELKNEKNISSSMLENILKIQQFVYEVEN